MSDLIDRQAAIDALDALSYHADKYVVDGEEHGFCTGISVGIRQLELLPSAEPTETFEWCTDCKEYDQEKHCCHRWSKVIRNTVEELKAEREEGEWIDSGTFKYKHGGKGEEAKRLFGTEWRTMQRVACSVCNKTTLVDNTIAYEFCPHCGARMIAITQDDTK